MWAPRRAILLLVQDARGILTASVTAALFVMVLTLAFRRAAAQELAAVWSARYNGPVPGHSFGRAVTMDGAGDVVIAADFHLGDGSSDYAVLKYRDDGSLLWMETFDDGGPGTDSVVAVAADFSGGVLVAGTASELTSSDTSHKDLLTVKMDRAGRVLWAARFGQRGRYDTLSGLAVDEKGNAVVVGSEHGDHYVAVLYDRDGNEVWVARYGESPRYFNSARAVTFAPNGDILVTGDLGANMDTLRYDPQGNLLWSARAPNTIGSGIAAAPSGQVLVCGASFEEGNRFAVLNYDGGGNLAWGAFVPKQGGTEITAAIALGSDGSTSVAEVTSSGGLSSESEGAIFRLDADGEVAWKANYPSGSPRALAVDAKGNTFVTGWSRGRGTDYLTAAFAPTGAEIWRSIYDGAGQGDDGIDDIPEDIALDAVGSIYVTGSSSGVAELRDVATIKYGSTGRQLWVARDGGRGNVKDTLTGLAVDREGAVYITGTSARPRAGRDIATVKYNASGEEVWTARFAEPRHSTHGAAVAVDHQGNVIVIGSQTVHDVQPQPRLLTMKYDAGGSLLWVVSHADSYASALALGSAGNVHVAGRMIGSSSFDLVTLKYDPQGSLLWAATLDDRGGDDQPGALVVGLEGTVAVTGQSGSGGGTGRFTTVMYDAEGKELWRAHQGGDSIEGRGYAIAPARGGGVFVTGHLRRDNQQLDVATLRYDREGRLLWVGELPEPSPGIRSGRGLAVDHSGNVYVAATGGLVVKYAPNGTLLWQVVHEDTDFATVALAETGHLLVAGHAFLETLPPPDPDGAPILEPNHDFVLLEYDPGGRLLQSGYYGNPRGWCDTVTGMVVHQGRAILAGTSGQEDFSDYLTVSFQVPEASFVRGDANQDGRDDIADGIWTISILFRTGQEFSCRKAADRDDDGMVALSDAIHAFQYQFLGGPAPVAPYPECGRDMTADALDCSDSPECR